MRELSLAFWRAVWRDLPPAPTGATDAPAKAKQILSGDEFRPSRQSFIDRVFSWIGRHLLRAFESSVTGGSRLVSYVIFAAFFALLVWVLTRLRKGGFTKLASADAAGVDVTVHDDRTAADWLREAETFEAAGEWKAALRARYRLLVAQLVDRRVLTDVPGRTPGEYRTELADGTPEPDQVAAFAAATDLFELAWYGDEPTGADENARFRLYSRRVLERDRADA